MENIHEWLYDHYAEPRLNELPAFRRGRLCPLLRLAPEDQRLWLEGQMNTLQLEWCTAAFTLGVQAGLRLAR